MWSSFTQVTKNEKSTDEEKMTKELSSDGKVKEEKMEEGENGKKGKMFLIIVRYKYCVGLKGVCTFQTNVMVVQHT